MSPRHEGAQRPDEGLAPADSRQETLKQPQLAAFFDRIIRELQEAQGPHKGASAQDHIPTRKEILEPSAERALEADPSLVGTVISRVRGLIADLTGSMQKGFTQAMESNQQAILRNEQRIKEERDKRQQALALESLTRYLSDPTGKNAQRMVVENLSRRSHGERQSVLLYLLKRCSMSDASRAILTRVLQEH